MDHLSPPALTRSPTSPPNDLAYPSPPMMVEQQYKLASAYNSGASCSLPPSYETEISLPPLEAMSHHDWNSTPGMHGASTSSNVPPILSAEYDPFQAPYEQIPSGYSQDVYPPPPPAPSASTPHQAPSPPLDGRSRTPMPLTPRIKMESSEYPNSQDMSRYSSPPRSMAAPYSNESGPYQAAATTSSYAMEGQPAWAAPKSEYHYPQASPMYPPTTDMTAQFINDARRLSRASRYARKQPRRLTPKEDANYQCEHEGCGKLFSRSYNYKAHLETHDKQRAYPFPCPVKDCNKKFVRKTDLQRHNASVHLKERSHKCEFCSRPFARKDTLRRHMDDGCSKRFSCTIDIGPESYESLQRPLPGFMPSHSESPSLPPNGSGLLAPIPPLLRPSTSWATR